MDKRILLGIDADLSPMAQQIFQVVSELFGQTPASLILLHVLPVPQPITGYSDFYMGEIAAEAAQCQRRQARELLHKARLFLQQQGITLERTEGIIRVGAPADEIARVAKELCVQLIVIGSHENSPKNRLRRLLIGSTSRRLLGLTSCPVLIVVPPKISTDDLVSWYESAIKAYLQEQTTTLSVLTPVQVARQFAPHTRKTSRRKEIRAATRALDQLVSAGILCKHTIEGQPCYVND